MGGDANALLDKQKRTLDQARMALATGNLDRLLETFAPCATHRTLETVGWVSTPKSELKSLLLQRMSGRKEPVWLTNQQRVRIRNLSIQGVVVSEGVLMGTLPSGTSISQPVLTIAEFDETGTITEERLYYDMVAARGGTLADMPARSPAEVAASATPWISALGTPVEASNIEVVKDFLATLCSVDLESTAELLHDDAFYVDQSFGVVLKGRTSFCGALSNLLRAFPDLAIAINRIWAADRYVVAETAFSGTWSEPLALLGPPSNRTACVHSAQILEIVGGRISACTAYRSLAELSAALGVRLRGGEN